MASVNDATGIQAEADRQHELLQQADIPEADREAIDKFVRHRRVHGSGSGSYSAGTERDDLNKLRLSSERADTPLTSMGMDDVNALLDVLTAPRDQGGYGITSGIDAYTRVLRVFYRWLDRHDEYGEFGWWEQVKTGNVEFPEPSDRRFPTEDEIEAIKRAAGQRGTMRDVALVAFYEDTAVRRTLGAQLRIGDISLDGARATFTPNAEGEAQKGVEVKPYPIYDAVADLRVWTNRHHPDPDNPEAPLWAAPNYHERRDRSYCHNCGTDLPGERETCPECGEAVYDDGAIGSRQVNRLFKKFADTAGLNLDEIEVKPHAFRHAAVGRWKEQGYSLPEVQRRTAWRDKAAAEMWARYGDPDDEKIDQRIDELEGRESAAAEADDGAGAGADRREARTCGTCKMEDVTTDHCPNCGAAVHVAEQTGPTITLDPDQPVGDVLAEAGLPADGGLKLELPAGYSIED